MFSNLRTNRLFRKGVRRIEAADYEQALACFEQVVAQHPNDAPAYSNIGYCQFRLGRREEALAAYLRARELAPNDPHYACDLASVYLKIGRIDLAQRLFSEALTLDTACLPAMVGLGECLNLRGAHADAAEMFQRLIRLDANSVEGHCGLGMACLGVKRYDQAEAALNEAIRLRPDHAASHEALARLYEAAGRPRQALAALEEAARYQPYSARAQCAVGDASIRRGQWQRALNAYQRALRLRPDLSSAKAGLTIAQQQLADVDPPAEPETRRPVQAASARAASPAHAPKPTTGSQDLPALEDDDAPFAAPLHAADATPSLTDAPDLADFVDAPAPQTAPDYANEPSHSHRSPSWTPQEAPGPPAEMPADQSAARLAEIGEDAFLAGRYADALEAWDEAARIDDRDPVLHNNRAAALLELGEHRLAAEACRRALQLDPRYAVGRATLCEVLIRSGDRRAAQRELPALRKLDADLAHAVEEMLHA